MTGPLQDESATNNFFGSIRQVILDKWKSLAGDLFCCNARTKRIKYERIVEKIQAVVKCFPYFSIAMSAS